MVAILLHCATARLMERILSIHKRCFNGESSELLLCYKETCVVDGATCVAT